MEKQPAQQSLETGGLGIGGGIGSTRTTAGAVASTADQILLRLAEQSLQTLQGLGLGSGPHGPHNLAVQFMGPGWPTAADLSLMEFPDSIPEPGELQGTELIEGGIGAQSRQPVISWRGCQERTRDRA